MSENALLNAPRLVKHSLGIEPALIGFEHNSKVKSYLSQMFTVSGAGESKDACAPLVTATSFFFYPFYSCSDPNLAQNAKC